MSEIVLSNQASPGALGANLSAFFFSVTGAPSYVGNDSVVHVLAEFANGSLAVPANLSVAANITTTFNNTANVGSVTLNGAAAGRAIVAAGANSVTITSNMVTANSKVFPVAAANDVTGRVNAVVTANGSVTLHCTAPTANMAVDFLIINQA